MVLIATPALVAALAWYAGRWQSAFVALFVFTGGPLALCLLVFIGAWLLRVVGLGLATMLTPFAALIDRGRTIEVLLVDPEPPPAWLETLVERLRRFGDLERGIRRAAPLGVVLAILAFVMLVRMTDPLTAAWGTAAIVIFGVIGLLAWLISLSTGMRWLLRPLMDLSVRRRRIEALGRSPQQAAITDREPIEGVVEAALPPAKLLEAPDRTPCLGWHVRGVAGPHHFDDAAAVDFVLRTDAGDVFDVHLDDAALLQLEDAGLTFARGAFKHARGATDAGPIPVAHLHVGDRVRVWGRVVKRASAQAGYRGGLRRRVEGEPERPVFVAAVSSAPRAPAPAAGSGSASSAGDAPDAR